MVKEDFTRAGVLEAMELVFRHRDQGDVDLVTSQAMGNELAKIPPQYRAAHEYLYRWLGSVPFLPPARPPQTSFTDGGRLGQVTSGIREEPAFTNLRRILGRGKKRWPNAEHLFEAKNANIEYFITTDYASILNHKQEIEAQLGIKARDPVELVA